MPAVDLTGDLFTEYAGAATRKSAGGRAPLHPAVITPAPIAVALKARDAGMQRAIEHAEATTPKWADLALEYLRKFAAGRREPFISELVSNQSKLDGFPQPPTDRAWGHVYRKAAKAGIIVRDGTGVSLRRHASICPRWRSLI